MRRTLLTGLLVGSFALPLSALELSEYDRLSLAARTAYMNDLIDASLRSLYRNELYDDYAAFRTLFGFDQPSSARISRGMIEFAGNIDAAHELIRREPDRQLHVEDAFAKTLRDNGIEPPPDLMTLMSDDDEKP